MDVSVEERGIKVFEEHPNVRDLVSRIEAYESSEQCSMGIRLMIIELRKYNEIGELLIENRTTGSQAQVIYQDEVQEASVTRAAVCMGVEETGM